jgi:trimeric autotransporter adhesin
MSKPIPAVIVPAVVAMSQLSLALAPLAAQCDPVWLPGPGGEPGIETAGLPGIDGAVNALVVWDPDGPGPMPAGLVVGGDFRIAGEVLATNIAFWDGAAWTALGPGITGIVHALAVDPSTASAASPGGHLIIGGAFVNAGGISARRIVRYDGATWSPMGLGMDTTVLALAVTTPPAGSPPGTPSTIIAGGQFTTAGAALAGRIARWNGQDWEAVGAAAFDGAVRSIAARSADDFYVGGEFQNVGTPTAPSTPVSRIARWNGQSWSALGAGANGTVLALAFMPGSTDLVAGGQFQTIGGQSHPRIARWNGSSWQGMAGGMSETVNALTVLPQAPAGFQLIAGGSFITAGSVTVNRLARWTGSGWAAFGEGASATVNALATGMGGPGGSGEFYIGGSFTTAGTTGVRRVARWTGSQFARLGDGMNSSVLALTASPSGDGSFVAGGHFTTAGTAAANRIARFESSGGWSTLGAGLDREVRALAILPAGGGGGGGAGMYDIIAGGGFQQSGPIAVARIGRWNGQAWSAMGGGMNDEVRALAVLPEYAATSGGRLIAAGRFTSTGSGAMNRIARWDPAGASGGVWSSVESGLGQSAEALAVLPGGSGALLAVGGAFTSAGPTSAQRIATWGEIWQELGAGVNNTVTAIAVRPTSGGGGGGGGGGSELIVGGTFTQAGGGAANRIARWTGTSWGPLGSGVNGSIAALAVLGNGDVVAGGAFSSAGGVAAQSIARWDGSQWRPMVGSSAGGNAGLNGNVSALTLLPSGDLLVGGEFTTAGGQVSAFLARWGCESTVPACYANCDSSTTAPILNVDDFSCFINQFGAALTLPHNQQVTHYANCDGSTAAPVLNIDDFTCFINEFSVGCR